MKKSIAYFKKYVTMSYRITGLLALHHIKNINIRRIRDENSKYSVAGSTTG
jgi:hypothetical protein